MMNDNVEGLSFSREALSNRSLFLAQLNDINIYVEDVGKEYEYEEIFERLFRSVYKELHADHETGAADNK